MAPRSESYLGGLCRLIWLISGVFLPLHSPAASFLTGRDDGKAAIAMIDLSCTEVSADGRYFVIGDMRFRRDLVQEKTGFAVASKWTDGVVYYEFDPAVPAADHQLWLDGATKWSQVADVFFVERTTEENYIRIRSDFGSWSEVGMVGGMQEMGIGAWTEPYVIAHEVGHALGLWHEHQRSDRDDFVTVHPENVYPDRLDNFAKMETVNYGEYDFDSIMHYPAYAGSIDGSITIEPKPAYIQWLNVMGQTSHISVLDAWGMAQQYGGSGVVPELASPATVTAQLSFLPGVVDLAWSAVPEASGYLVEYGENAEGPPFVTDHPGTPAPGTNVGNTLARSIEGLTPGTRYYFSIRSVDSYRISGYSESAIVRIPPVKTDDPYEPNNDIASAWDFSAEGGRPLSSIGGLANMWDADYYRIALAEDHRRLRVHCSYAWVDGRIGIRLMDPGGWQLGEAYEWGKDHQLLDMVLPAAGTYYILAFGQAVGNTYDLWWTDTPDAAQGVLWMLY